MQEISGIALIAAAVALLVAARRACALGDDSWIVSDTFVLSVVGPGFLVALVGGGAMLLYPTAHGESAPAALAGTALAAVIAGLAAAQWRHGSRGRTARGANVLEFTANQPGQPTEPDAPRPPVAPHTRRAA